MGTWTAVYGIMVLSGWAVATDLSSGKIRNYICAAGWLGGLFLASCGVVPFAEWAGGCILPLAGGFLLYRRRWMGAGDVKLLSAIGGLCGASQLLFFLFAVFFAGGVLSLLMAMREKNPAAKLHFSVPVLMGSALWIASQRLAW